MAPTRQPTDVGTLDHPRAECLLNQCLGCGVLVIGNGVVLSHTPDAARILPALASACPPVAVLPQALQDMAQEALRTHLPVTGRPCPAQTLEGRPVQACALPVAARNGDTQVVVVLIEPSASDSVVDALRRLDRLASLGTLSAGMAHEVKNALVAVRTFIDLLLENNRDADLVQVVGRELNRIDSIVSHMLRFVVPAVAEKESVHLNETIEHSLRLVQHQLDGRMIVLVKQLDADPDLIEGDDYKLEQAILNLLLNAVEAIGSEGTLTVTSEFVPANEARLADTIMESGNCVQICVGDTGMGMSEYDVGRIFEPYFTTKPQGTGLGLPITRRIVEEHGGSITFSTEPAKGTVFTLRFPARDRGW